MSQLNNSDDMTLVDFLLGLPSAGEVQEYVTLYLGKTPQANAFATELIRQKRADPSLAEGLGNGELSKVAARGCRTGFAGRRGKMATTSLGPRRAARRRIDDSYLDGDPFDAPHWSSGYDL